MRPDGGSMAVAMSGVIAIVAVLGVAVASLGMLYAAKAKAVNAADAASLAAAVSTYPAASPTAPVSAARSAAVVNGAVLLSCGCPRDWSLSARTVEVVAGVPATVPIFGTLTVRAASRAEFNPREWLGR